MYYLHLFIFKGLKNRKMQKKNWKSEETSCAFSILKKDRVIYKIDVKNSNQENYLKML